MSNSPKAVTEDVDVDPDRSVALLDVGVGAKPSFKESVSRESSDSPSVLWLTLPESESNKKTKSESAWIDRILSSNGRTGLGIVSFGIRRLGQHNRGCRDFDVRHQERGNVRFMAERGRFQSRLATLR